MSASNRPGVSDDSAAYRRYLAALVLFHQAAADAAGLTGTVYQASNVLDLDGPMTSGDLARRVGLSLGAGSRLVDRLIAAGVARRTPDPQDRRRVLIEHTGVLPGDLERTLGTVRAPIAEALDGLSAPQRAGVAAYLEAATGAYAAAARELRPPD